MAIALTFAAPLAAQAPSQCPVAEYAVTGAIVAAGDVPVVGARVAAQWEERATGLATTRTATGPGGQFALRIQFDTYSGQTFTGKQKCEAVLEAVQLQVTAEGYRETNRSVALGKEPASVKIQLRPR